jgi:hypothetical protein
MDRSSQTKEGERSIDVQNCEPNDPGNSKGAKMKHDNHGTHLACFYSSRGENASFRLRARVGVN